MDQEPANEALQALNRAVWDSNEVLASASTTAKLNKGLLTLNRAKLFAEKRSALGTIDDLSVRIEDVLNISVTLGPISGTIKIATKFNTPGAPFSIGPFHRKDALRLKRIIQGYIIALQRRIDLNLVPTDELISQLYEIGTDDHSL